MTIQVPDEIVRAIEEILKSCDIPPEQLLLNDLRAHFPPIPPELQAEFDAWEAASDEDAVRIEQSLCARSGKFTPLSVPEGPNECSPALRGAVK